LEALVSNRVPHGRKPGKARGGKDERDAAPLLEEARREAVALSEGAARLSSLIERALADGKEPEAKPARPRQRRFRRVTPKEGLRRARVVAVQMALAGSPREAAERELAGTGTPEDLAAMLDEVFGEDSPND
jgi:hypothetical protein